jgi:hypothetical protein
VRTTPWYQSPWYVTCQSIPLSSNMLSSAGSTPTTKNYQLKPGVFNINTNGGINTSKALDDVSYSTI